jgi:hypothetical protein
MGRALIGIAIATAFLAAALVPVFDQAFANDPRKKAVYDPRIPPLGAVYALNIYGDGHIAGTDIFAPVSMNLEYEVIGVKTSGIPIVTLELVEGTLNIGDQNYTLVNGGSYIGPVHRVNVKDRTDDGLTTIIAYAAMVSPLPLSIDKPVEVVPAIYHSPARIQVYLDYWVIDYFTGDITRIS